MITQEQYDEIYDLLEELFCLAENQDIENRCCEMQELISKEKKANAPGSIFWELVGVWTQADLYHHKWSKELLAAFDDEIDAAWLDHLALTTAEITDESYIDAIEEILNRIGDDHDSLAEMLENEIESFQS